MITLNLSNQKWSYINFTAAHNRKTQTRNTTSIQHASYIKLTHTEYTDPHQRSPRGYTICTSTGYQWLHWKYWKLGGDWVHCTSCDHLDKYLNRLYQLLIAGKFRTRNATLNQQTSYLISQAYTASYNLHNTCTLIFITAAPEMPQYVPALSTSGSTESTESLVVAGCTAQAMIT